MCADLLHLAERQLRVLTRQQLIEAGVSSNKLRAQVAARRWQIWGSHVVVLHNWQLSRRQVMWAAVLDAGEPAALGSHSALEVDGFVPFAREAEQIHLLVPRGHKINPHPQVVVHETRRIRDDRHRLDRGPRRAEPARAALDAAAWQPWPRFACAMAAAVVQQGVCTPDDLEEAMGYVGRIRHKAHLRLAIRDIRGGSEALSELDLVRLCRAHGLQLPQRQVRRTGTSGQLRFLDAEWVLPDGRRIVLEVDGAHHMDVTQWQDDMRREREIVLSGRTVLRATSIEVRAEPALIAADLRAAGVPPTCQ